MVLTHVFRALQIPTNVPSRWMQSLDRGDQVIVQEHDGRVGRRDGHSRSGLGGFTPECQPAERIGLDRCYWNADSSTRTQVGLPVAPKGRYRGRHPPLRPAEVREDGVAFLNQRRARTLGGHLSQTKVPDLSTVLTEVLPLSTTALTSSHGGNIDHQFPGFAHLIKLVVPIADNAGDEWRLKVQPSYATS